MEIWKNVVNYEEIYQVSNLGKIKSLYKNRILINSLNKSGYYQVQLFKNKQYKQFLVHRLVAQAFIPNPDNKPQVNHINAVKTDNFINNLEWCTPRENMDHAVKYNLLKKNSFSLKEILDTSPTFKSR